MCPLCEATPLLCAIKHRYPQSSHGRVPACWLQNALVFQDLYRSVRSGQNCIREAARAGDAGKGFAVVAQEVKKLAEKSKLASDDIETLSKSGQQVAKLSGEKLSEIIPEISKRNPAMVSA